MRTVPPGYSLDWSSNDITGQEWTLTLTDDRDVAFVQNCWQGETPAGCLFVTRTRAVDAPPSSWGIPPGTTELLSAAVTRWPPQTVSQPALVFPQSTRYELHYYNVTASSFGAKALCFYRYGGDLADFRYRGKGEGGGTGQGRSTDGSTRRWLVRVMGQHKGAA